MTIRFKPAERFVSPSDAFRRAVRLSIRFKPAERFVSTACFDDSSCLSTYIITSISKEEINDLEEPHLAPSPFILPVLASGFRLVMVETVVVVVMAMGGWNRTPKRLVVNHPER